MASFSFTSTGELQVTPSPNSSPNDFDFLVGNWTIQNKKLNSRLDNCQTWIEFQATGTQRKILQGLGNIDSFLTTVAGAPFEGMSLRIFNPKTALWSIYWADTNRLALDKPVVGSFDNNLGRFYSLDVFNGRDILVLFEWNKTDPQHPVWTQAFSTDGGNNWEVNWYMMFKRER
jgi:hypothetical protein